MCSADGGSKIIIWGWGGKTRQRQDRGKARQDKTGQSRAKQGANITQSRAEQGDMVHNTVHTRYSSPQTKRLTTLLRTSSAVQGLKGHRGGGEDKLEMEGGEGGGRSLDIVACVGRAEVDC